MQVLFSLPDFHGAKQELRHAYKLNTPIESDQKTISKNLKLGKNRLIDDIDVDQEK